MGRRQDICLSPDTCPSIDIFLPRKRSQKRLSSKHSANAWTRWGFCPRGRMSGAVVRGAFVRGQMCVHRVGRRYVPSDAYGDDTLHYDVMGAYFNLSGVTDGCACALPTNHFSGPGSVIGPVCVSQSVKNIRGGRINNKKHFWIH